MPKNVIKPTICGGGGIFAISHSPQHAYLIKCHSNLSQSRSPWYFQCNLCVALHRQLRRADCGGTLDCGVRLVRGRSSGQSGGRRNKTAGVFALPGLLPIYGLALNGRTRGQRHLSITNGTFALNVNAREAIWLNNCFLWRNKGVD